ncbi:MAG TPA: diaminopimelate epimerase [Thermoanaerobaculia bacterium]|nr:diaminopimelate epimerase [Thermoanaerobaculia bacterium]
MTDFFKVSGGGNDFLALAEPAEAPATEDIRAWCGRGVSLGADGLFVLRRAGPRVEMDYFNSDGLPADLCLNGTRCAAQLAFHLGWADNTVEIQTGAGPVPAHRIDERNVRVELPAPGTPRQMTVEAAGTAVTGGFVTVGVPHFVLLWPELERAPLAGLAPPLRRHAAFGPAGTNVNFARFPERHRMEIRSYERGVEGETLACGTGVLAGAAAGLALGQAELPLQVLTRGGFILAVEETPQGDRWSLAGDARVVARGELFAGASLAPAAPDWDPAREDG